MGIRHIRNIHTHTHTHRVTYTYFQYCLFFQFCVELLCVCSFFPHMIKSFTYFCSSASFFSFTINSFYNFLGYCFLSFTFWQIFLKYATTIINVKIYDFIKIKKETFAPQKILLLKPKGKSEWENIYPHKYLEVGGPNVKVNIPIISPFSHFDIS